ncbi:MAG: glycoside hydrolase family 57 protein, partial [bacterium]
MKKLFITFLWHFHQPFYKDNLTNFYYLPWVRLHSTKGYWDMINVLEEVPEAKAVFNFTPSLLYQLKDIAENNIKDKFLELSLRDASDLAEEEKIFILNNFFMSNWETMIFPIKRYKELLFKKKDAFSEEKNIVKKFTVSDFRDLQVLFNLSWCGFTLKNKDKFIQELLKKGNDFTELEKKELLKKQKEIVSSIIPIYKKFQNENRIEISTSPFYHPILPLLCQEGKFDFKKDAQIQIQKSVKFYEEIFEKKPQGFWPSEGSVSQNTIPFYAENGVKWIASDEEILMNSEKEEKNKKELIYQPYFLRENESELNILFRDKELSNLISFNYASQLAKHSINDMISHFKKIKESKENKIVSIILDGENPWEYYQDGGENFLKGLYEAICKDPELELSTINDYLKKYPSEKKIKKLYSGSWIDHSFKIWIGKTEKNIAWDYLDKTRNSLIEIDINNEKAWEEIYIAEGSDWFWWFDDDFSSNCDEVFDFLFRQKLINVYKILQSPIPDYLKDPISTFKKNILTPLMMINPRLDGKITNFYEWLNAGKYYVNESTGTMYCSYSIIKKIYYGYNVNSLYFRLDGNFPLEKEIIIEINQIYQILISLKNKTKYIIENLENGTKKEIENLMQIDKIIELEILFSFLNIKIGDQINFLVKVKENDIIRENWPMTGTITFKLPTENDILSDW